MFNVFDDDHSGELDEDEFCGAMELTGGQGGRRKGEGKNDTEALHVSR